MLKYAKIVKYMLDSISHVSYIRTYSTNVELTNCGETMLFSMDILKQAETAIVSFLKKIPFVSILEIKSIDKKGEESVDFSVNISIDGRVRTLYVEVKSNGQPKFARESVNVLLRVCGQKVNSYGIFCAPYISSESSEICRCNNVGYFDFSGNCHLSFDNIFVEKSGNANQFSEKREMRTIFSTRATRILRVILNDPLKKRITTELASEARVSAGLVANIRKLLRNKEFIQEYEDGGFSLIKPDKLLAEWTENYSFRDNKIYEYYSLDDAMDAEKKLVKMFERKKINYALTGFSGSLRLAPAVIGQNKTMAYISRLEEKLMTEMNLKKVDSGGNVFLVIPYDEGVFYGNIEKDGFNVVSPIQLYLDLKSNRGRGEEAAEFLLKQVIRKLW